MNVTTIASNYRKIYFFKLNNTKHALIFCLSTTIHLQFCLTCWYTFFDFVNLENYCIDFVYGFLKITNMYEL